MKLKISMKEAVFTKDLDGDGKAEVPPDREGETNKPEVDMDGGLDDSNNDGKTDTSREISDDEEPEETPEEAPEEPEKEAEDAAGDSELADAINALEEEVMKVLTSVLTQG